MSTSLTPVLNDDDTSKGSVVPNSFAAISQQEIQGQLTQELIQTKKYVEKLEALLKEHNIEVPLEFRSSLSAIALHGVAKDRTILVNGSIDELRQLLEGRQKLAREQEVAVEYHNLHFHTTVDTEREISTVFTTLRDLLFFWVARPQKKLDILANVSGRILPRKMTLLIGPPGSGKSVLLKALAGRLRESGKAKYSGHVFYDGDDLKSGKFLVGKVADYVEQGDTHEAVLTVKETMKFAWKCTTGGHHSYGFAKDEAVAAILDEDDESCAVVQNVIIGLGLNGCKDTYVGNGHVRGVSGGQKRRVTIGEMVVCPRPIKMMDCISNGLDTATTFDIIQATRLVSEGFGRTTVISLLQPPPDVYNLFDEIILLCEGHEIYHGPREHIMSYFEALGYVCPVDVDEADFLQELPTPEGRRFINRPDAPYRPEDLARVWKESPFYKQMVAEMRYPVVDEDKGVEESSAHRLSLSNTKTWYGDQLEAHPGTFWFYLKLCMERDFKVILRDANFSKARIGQSLLVGAIAGSLFNNISTEDTNTMNGFLFNTVLFGALGSFAILPIVFEQKAVYYKQKDALFFPTGAFTLSQTISMIPLQIVETILYVTIVYWAAGLSDEEDGSRFLTFIVMCFAFSLCIGQLFRLIASCLPDMRVALPASGIIVVVMVLFSGFIQPKTVISDGWIWFYWMNPIAWVLKAVTVNEFSASNYDFKHCLNPSCTQTERFGDYVLKSYGNPTEMKWIWYSFAVILAEFFFFFFLTYLAQKYIHTEPTPPPPVRYELADSDSVNGEKVANPRTVKPVVGGEEEQRPEDGDVEAAEPPRQHYGAVHKKVEQLPFDPISFAFRDISYTVTLPSGDDIELLHEVNGFFEPATITALMGSSGAGKTTLLDVLAGRKNTGVVQGEMFLNGLSKVDAYFRRVMGYVEQFDTLHVRSTPREAIQFNAELRLSSDTTSDQKRMWVDSIVSMMDLEPIQHDLIGIAGAGGMSFEQRKRISIGTELAANPSILFLDEPTTGLDSRAAQALIVNIRRIAASGRSVVCTIHQPSTAIFNSFDSLLLLKKGGRTVFFGPLGQRGSNLVQFFESIPGVAPMPSYMNPATWMLDVIGAGTSVQATKGDTDFAAYYTGSSLNEINRMKLTTLCVPNDGSRRLTDADVEALQVEGYRSSYAAQFRLLFTRFQVSYWRNPGYSLMRNVTNIVIALIFASAYPFQTYNDNIETMSRAAVIYITALFCGIMAMMLVVPVTSNDRPVFYHEQQSRMYSIFLYSAAQFFTEIPYLILGALSLSLPFFYIVGFNNVGPVTQKFFWFWFFNFLLEATMLFMGVFFVYLAPNESTCHVFTGLTNTVLGLFCGFLIAEQAFPDFWTFMYWLDPLHYALEGLFMTMFHDDTTKITSSDGTKMTAQYYITQDVFTTWKYDHVGIDVMALLLMAGAAVVGSYLCLVFLRHDKN